MSERDNHCEYVRPDGSPCGAYKVHGSRFCMAHTPQLAEVMQAARSKGGKRPWSMDLGDWQEMDLKTLEDSRQFMSMALNDLRAGRIPPQLMTAIASGVQALSKVLDMIDLESRLEKIEERQGRQP